MSSNSEWRQPVIAVGLLVLGIACGADPSAARGPSSDSSQSNPGDGKGSATGNAGTTAVEAGRTGSQGSGGSASAPMTPSAMSAGSGKPKAALDPNLEFTWPESSPGGGNSCQAGTYTGTFDCLFTDPSGLIPDVELDGPVTLTFTKSMDGEFLEITNGEFEALGNLFIGGRAKIEGKLDCNSLMLDAMAVDGAWAIGDPAAPLVPGGGLTGEITGTLDPASGTLSGQWSFEDPELGACPGTWSVMYAP